MGGMPMGGMFMGAMPMGGTGGGKGMGGGMPFNLADMMGGMGGKGMQTQAAPEQFDAIPNGTRVLVRGLVSAATHNGELGTVREFDRGRGRYSVQLEDGNTLALKPQNLLQLVRKCVITGIQSQAELNGQQAGIYEWDDEKQRYSVRLESNMRLTVKPGNIILPKATRVCVCGLVGGAQHNGKWGCIRDIDEAAGRYNVQVSAQQSIRIKFENVRV
jgi:hypothetical protein